MAPDAVETIAPSPALQRAEQTFQSHAPHLWPWNGWYALVVPDRLVGVFPTLWAAISAVDADQREGVLVRRIGSDDATPFPSADGGTSPELPNWAH